MKTIPLVSVLFASQLFAADPTSLREVAAAKSTETPVVKGSDGWLFLPAELRHLSVGKFWGEDAAKVSKATKPENADPLPAILDFHSQLAAMGIELIVVPVPAKVMVVPEALGAASTEREDPFHQEFYELLRKDGIIVVDLLPDFLAQKTAEKAALFCRQDTHWSGLGTVLAAEKIAELLKDKAWMKEVPKVQTATQATEVEISGDLWGMLPGDKPEKEKITLRLVGTEASGGSIPIAEDKTSPVLLLGDSHTLVFHAGGDMLASGAGLADQLAADLGIGIDVIGVRGSGATPARINLMRRARADAGYLAGKKVVIWCFTVRELTESSGWSKVPLTKK